MFDKFNLEELGKTLSTFQEEAKKLDEESAKVLLTGKGGGGLVEVTINGKGEVVDVKIDPSLKDDLASVQIMLVSAINEAFSLVKEHQRNSAMNLVSQFAK